MHPIAKIALAVSLFAPPALAQEAKSGTDYLIWDDLFGKGSRLQFYGFLRADAQYDDSRFNDPQIPGYVQSEDPSAPPSIGADKDDSEFTIHGRLTRFGANVTAPPIDGLGNPDITGAVEVDFYNIGLNDSDSRSALRMRKAFVDLAWGRWSLRAGQDWDVISPLYPAVNADLVMWGAGNTGDRRPQVRLQYDAPGGFRSTFGIGLSGAVAGAVAENGLRSGENSGEPMVNARVGYHGKTGQGASYQMGLWGHVSSEDYDATGSGSDQSYDSQSVGIDFRVPLSGTSLWLLGEAWQGENLDDIRGGIFQGVNSSTGEEIEAEGGFLELGFQANPNLTLHLGYSIDDPDDDDLSSGQRSKNEVAYIASRWTYGALNYGVEYLDWTTEYKGFDDGDAGRLVGFITLNF